MSASWLALACLAAGERVTTGWPVLRIGDYSHVPLGDPQLLQRPQKGKPTFSPVQGVFSWQGLEIEIPSDDQRRGR